MGTRLATNSSAFHFYQWLGIVAMTNLFAGGANGGGAPNGVTVTLDLPIETAPDTLAPFRACYDGDPFVCIAEGEVKFRFTGPYTRTDGVRGYPAFVLGSRSGGNETWGVACGQAQQLLPGTRDAGNVDTIYDLQPAQNATGFPAFAGSIPNESRVIVKWRDTGQDARYNIFTDTYWHDVSTLNNLPRDPNGNPIATLQNTINGMNVKPSAMWNFNFWHRVPPEMTAASATGGQLVATGIEIEPGKPVDIYVKHEDVQDNNFAYVAFVYQNTPGDGVGNSLQGENDLDYKAYHDWVLSNNTGPGTFFTEVWLDPETIAIGQDMAVHPRFPKGLRRPDTAMVVSGMEIGMEMWGVDDNPNDDTPVGEVTFDHIGFISDGTEFGKVGDIAGLNCSFPVITEASNVLGNFCDFTVISEGDASCVFAIQTIGECDVAPLVCGECPPARVPQGCAIQQFIGQESPVNQVTDFLGDYPGELIVTVRSVEAIGDGTAALSGNTGFIWTPDPDIDRPQSAIILLRYVFQCDGRRAECTMEIPAYAIDDHDQLQDEKIVVTSGQFANIDITDETLVPAGGEIQVNPFGSLVPIAGGWQFRYPPGAFGVVEVKVSSNGKSKNCLRKVTICVLPSGEIQHKHEGCDLLLWAKQSPG
ncbi:hypothetical protein AB833_19505 [Chromatiales bacterium (ex Bugula neritina AB1)]|nr:hypothetical protein AB833_19505 [Chromatiales bacterium (ex Bugula neritina AB1)]